MKKREDKFDDELFEDDIFDDDFTHDREDFAQKSNDELPSHLISNTKADPTPKRKIDFEIDDNIDDNDKEFELFEERYFKEKEPSYYPESILSSSSNKPHQKIKERVQRDKGQIESAGTSLMFAFSTILLMGMGLPVLLIFYFNSPPLDQHFFVMGVSYFKLLFIFFIISAVMVYTSLFFLTSRQFVIITVFLLSLFCSFPFIAGIRNDMTVVQAMFELKLFSNWPFFLKPAYLFFQIVLPFGIFIYAVLQIKNITNRSSSRRSYAYICIALYLSISAFIGFSILNRTGQPNFISYISPKLGAMGLFDVEELSTTPNQNSDPASQSQFVQLQTEAEPALVSPQLHPPIVVPQPEQAQSEKAEVVVVEQPPISDNVSQGIEPQLEELRAKSNHLLGLISKIEASLESEYQGIINSKPNSEPNLNELKSALNKTGNLDTKSINLDEVEKELQEVSAKLDMIWQAISREKALQKGQEQ
ncbi:MAG: hypothetical protein HQK68_06500 [Desulfamplus sp.]|nr:hypothetical protein [Desulfamplus sp.]